MKYLFTLLILSAFTAGAQTSIQDPNAVVRSLKTSFTAISVSDGITLYLSQGDEESIAVSYSDEKFSEHFRTEVEDGTLKLYYNSKGINYSDNKRRKLKAYVSFKSLSKLTASGGADVILPSAINLSAISLKFSSGSVFTGKVAANSIDVIQSSGSIINISGKAQKINIETNSGAGFRGYDFTVDYCVAKATSGAGIRISVQKELEAKANSGGSIHYKGSALISDINIDSGGQVKKA